jgi:hypothetical protein
MKTIQFILILLLLKSGERVSPRRGVILAGVNRLSGTRFNAHLFN